MAKKKKKDYCTISIPRRDLLYLMYMFNEGSEQELVEYIHDLVEENLHKITVDDIVEWMEDRMEDYSDEDKRDYIKDTLELFAGESGEDIPASVIKKVKERLVLELL